jgi:hypothetical protein
MSDFVVAVLCTAFALTAWGLIAMCERLREQRR